MNKFKTSQYSQLVFRIFLKKKALLPSQKSFFLYLNEINLDYYAP